MNDIPTTRRPRRALRALTIAASLLAGVVPVLGSATLFAPAAHAEPTGSAYTPFGAAKWDDDPHADFLVRHNPTGDLMLYPGVSDRHNPSREERVRIGTGWNGYTPFGLTDWNFDGHQDILAREDATGRLWLYPGRSVRWMSDAPRSEIGAGRDWRGYTSFGAADWDGDAHSDLVVRKDTGRTKTLWLYAPVTRPGFYPGPNPVIEQKPRWAQIGVGRDWGAYTPGGVAYWDRNRGADLFVGETATGNVFVYPGNGSRSTSSAQWFKILGGAQGYTNFGVTDWDDDGQQDVLARRDAVDGVPDADTGKLFLHVGAGPLERMNQTGHVIGHNLW